MFEKNNHKENMKTPVSIDRVSISSEYSIMKLEEYGIDSNY